MKTLKLLGIAPLVLLATTGFSQGHAVPRGGGSSGGGSSAGSRHTGGGGSGSGGGGGGGSASHSSPSNNSGGSSASSGGGQRTHTSPGAAARRPRPGSGTGTRDAYGNEYNHYGYYGGGYYGGYPYYGYGYGYGYPYYGYGYGYYPYWGYPAYGYGIGFSYYGGYPSGYYTAAPVVYGGDGGGGGGGSYESSAGAQVRTLIDPAKTLVYVDGRQAGTADDFDGMFQRLNISPGRHEIELRLEGYGTHTYTVYAAPEETLKLRWDMVKGGGATKEIIGQEYARQVEGDREQQRARERERELAREAERDRESPPAREVDSYPPADRPTIMAPVPGQGEVFLEIQPSDASVYIDGEFRGKAAQLTRLQLPEGRHRVEVVRPGYRTTETVITIEGEAKRLVIKLDR